MKKPGYKTTEFWMTVAVALLGLFMASGAVADGGVVARGIGAVLALLSTLGYDASRAKVKAADPPEQ